MASKTAFVYLEAPKFLLLPLPPPPAGLRGLGLGAAAKKGSEGPGEALGLDKRLN